MSDVAEADLQVNEVAGVEFETPEDLAQKMADDPDIWEKVMGAIDEVDGGNNDYLLPDKGNDSDDVVIPADKAGDDPAAVDGDDKGDAKDGAKDETKSENVVVALDGEKIKPEWLGTYKTEARTYSEAIEEMSKGNIEKDKTIDFYKFKRIPAIEKDLEAARAETAKAKAEAEELRKAREIAPVEVPGKAVDSAPAEKSVDTVIPDMPVPPPVPPSLTGDDLYDDDKVKENREEFEKYNEGILKYQQDVVEYNKAATKAAAEEAVRIATAEANERLEKVQGEVESLKTQRKTDADTEEKSAASKAVQAEYDMIEELRAEHPDVLGAGRPVSTIETDYLEFLTNLSGIAGIVGGVYQKDAAGNSTGKLRTEVTNALTAFQNPTSPMGTKFREAASENGIALPEDFDVLRKVYAIRRIKNANATLVNGRYVPISYQDAFKRAQESDPTLTPKNDSDEKRDAVLEEHNSRSRAVDAQGGFAKEPPSASSGGKPAINDIPVDNVSQVLLKRPEERTEDEVRMLWAIAEEKKVEPAVFGLDPDRRPAAK